MANDVIPKARVPGLEGEGISGQSSAGIVPANSIPGLEPLPVVTPPDGHGMVPARPASAGQEIDGAWFWRLATQTLERLPGAPGKGEGAVQATTRAVASILPEFHKKHGDGDLEWWLRRVFVTPWAESTDVLLERAVTRFSSTLSPDFASYPDPDQLLGATTPSRRNAGASQTREVSSAERKQRKGRKPPARQPSYRRDPREVLDDAISVRAAQHLHFALGADVAPGRLEIPQDKVDEVRAKYWKACRLASAARVNTRIADEEEIQFPSTKSLGRAVHSTLQARYLRKSKERAGEISVLSELTVHQRDSSVPIREMAEAHPETVYSSLYWSLGSPEAPFRIDIADIHRRALFEIKGVRSAPWGFLQLWSYEDDYNLAAWFDNRLAGTARKIPEMRGGDVPDYMTISFRETDPTSRKDYLILPFVVSDLPGMLLYAPFDTSTSSRDAQMIIDKIRTKAGVDAEAVADRLLKVVASLVVFVVVAALVAGALYISGGLVAAGGAVAAEGSIAAGGELAAGAGVTMITSAQAVPVLSEQAVPLLASVAEVASEFTVQLASIAVQ